MISRRSCVYDFFRHSSSPDLSISRERCFAPKSKGVREVILPILHGKCSLLFDLAQVRHAGPLCPKIKVIIHIMRHAVVHAMAHGAVNVMIHILVHVVLIHLVTHRLLHLPRPQAIVLGLCALRPTQITTRVVQLLTGIGRIGKAAIHIEGTGTRQADVAWRAPAHSGQMR